MSASEIQSRLQVKALIEKGYSQKISENQVRSYLHPDSYQEHGLSSLVRSMLNAYTPEMYLNQLNATLNRRNLIKELAETRIPITLVGGMEDKHVPKENYINFSELAPKSKLYLLENCGHFVPIEKANEMTNILKKIVLNA